MDAVVVALAAFALIALIISFGWWSVQKIVGLSSALADARVETEKAHGQTSLANLAEVQARKEAEEAGRIAKSWEARSTFFEEELNAVENHPIVPGPVRDTRERMRRAVQAISAAVSRRPTTNSDQSAGSVSTDTSASGTIDTDKPSGKPPIVPSGSGRVPTTGGTR